MNVSARLRRPFVLIGVVASLALGLATVRAAAAWTASTSPLADKPPSVESLQAALANEQARSAALQAQLDQLTTGSAELATALATAKDRITADTDHAAELLASLKAAEAKLAALERSIHSAKVAVTRAAAPAAPPAATPEPHEEGHEVDDD